MPCNVRLRVALLLGTFSLSISLVVPVRGENLAATLLSHRDAALKSIRASDAKKHVNALASDPFEGREAGTRGGRASAIYLTGELSKLKLQGGFADKSYIQDFGANMQNVLAILPGRDETLRHEYILIGAHYDHVGYGDARSSLGPVGAIHNGADDNASGVSALLEIAAACTELKVAPKRTILFAFWDGEEKNLLGSRHWVQNPTIPLNRLRFAINIDMVGRLNNNRVEIGGVRTAPGLREIVSRHNQDSALTADFPWEMPDNSDHYPFFEQGIPILFPFTGFHDDYHRPSDDADRINTVGIQKISQWMFSVLLDLSESEKLPRFRNESRSEGEAAQYAFEQAVENNEEGLMWRADEAEPDTVLVVGVEPGSRMASTGMKPKDRIYSIHEKRFRSAAKFRELLSQQAAAAEILIERDGRYFSVKLPARTASNPDPAKVTESSE